MNKEIKILDHTVELLIPDRDRYGKPIDTQSVIDELSCLVRKYIGGLQIYCGWGDWENYNGEPIHENLTALKSSFNTELLPELAAILITCALSLSNDLNQAEIAVKIDGKLILVSTSKSPENNKELVVHRIKRKNKQRKRMRLNKRRKIKC